MDSKIESRLKVGIRPHDRKRKSGMRGRPARDKMGTSPSTDPDDPTMSDEHDYEDSKTVPEVVPLVKGIESAVRDTRFASTVRKRLNAFVARAHITRDQKLRTLREIAKLARSETGLHGSFFGRHGSAVDPNALRAELVASLLLEVAHPFRINQGEAATCFAASREFILCYARPERYSSLMVELVTEGTARWMGRREIQLVTEGHFIQQDGTVTDCWSETQLTGVLCSKQKRDREWRAPTMRLFQWTYVANLTPEKQRAVDVAGSRDCLISEAGREAKMYSRAYPEVIESLSKCLSKEDSLSGEDMCFVAISSKGIGVGHDSEEGFVECDPEDVEKRKRVLVDYMAQVVNVFPLVLGVATSFGTGHSAAVFGANKDECGTSYFDYFDPKPYGDFKAGEKDRTGRLLAAELIEKLVNAYVPFSGKGFSALVNALGGEGRLDMVLTPGKIVCPNEETRKKIHVLRSRNHDG